MKTRLIFMLFFFLVLTGCTAGKKTASTLQPLGHDKVSKSYVAIKEALDRNGDALDYDTLVWIYQEMAQSQHALPHFGELLSTLIKKKNDNPRVDSMILILTAKTIRNSQTVINDVYGIIEAMLKMDHRLNSWVLAHIGGAIWKYPYDILEGDLLVDLLEEKAAHHLADSIPPKESFGYHFLPPPKGTVIPNYIASIEDQQTRVFERTCYYHLIHNQWTETQVEAALKQLQTGGIPETSEKTLRPLKYLVRHSNQFLKSSTSSQPDIIP